MEELFFTGWTTEGEMPFVFFHMVVHGVLILLNLGTDGADKLASSVLLIDIRHLYRLTGATGLQFFAAGRLLPALLAMTIMTATAVGVL